MTDTTDHPAASLPVPVALHGPVRITGLVPVQQVTSPEATWTTENAPLFGQAVLPAQLLSNDVRRVRAVIISLDQDIFLANEQEQLQLGPSQAAPAGGYWPKLVPLVIEDSQDLWAYSAAAAATRVTVHVEMGYVQRWA